jgi:serralysin
LVEGALEDRMANIEMVVGGTGGDTLLGDSLANRFGGGGGADRLTGNGGNDTLVGGAGKDTLTGAAAADQFKFNAVADSPAGVNRDIVTDFQVGVDEIDLAAIDGNANLGGKQNLFFKAGGFTGVAGQVIVQAGATTFVFADVNGDAVQDLTIELTGNKALNAGDFDFV